jgi:protease-4
MSDLDTQQTGGAGPGISDPPPPPPPAHEPPAATPIIVTAPPRKSRTGMFVFGALSGCVLGIGILVVIGMMIAAAGTSSTDFSLGDDKVAVIPIEGAIIESRDVMEAIERNAENDHIRAIVIRINSPGGSVSPSQEIYSAIRRARKDSGKPIVASLDSVAASGGYYIASACDRIVANPGSITGSIGVILQWFEMKELVQWAKLKPETITSGALKDAGSPFRELTENERQYFQEIVSQLHAQFVRDVAEGRKGKMTHAEVARVADGRVVTGEEAVRLKLVDEIGTIDDAVRTAGKLAGIKGEPTRVWPRRRDDRLLDLLTGGDAGALLEKIASRRVPQFLYQW